MVDGDDAWGKGVSAYLNQKNWMPEAVLPEDVKNAMRYFDEVKDAIIAKLLEDNPKATQEAVESYVGQTEPPEDVKTAYMRELAKLGGSDYLILESRDIKDLRYQVLEAMMDGWKPLGPPSHSIAMSTAGVTGAIRDDKESYIQGMIKEN